MKGKNSLKMKQFIFLSILLLSTFAQETLIDDTENTESLDLIELRRIVISKTQTGPHFAIISGGYTSSQKEMFFDHAKYLTTALKDTTPYKEYYHSLNFYAIFRPDTTEGVTPINTGEAFQIIKQKQPLVTNGVLLTNVIQYKGHAGVNMVFMAIPAVPTTFAILFLHEFSHLMRARDEYAGDKDTKSDGLNCATSPTNTSWSHLMGVTNNLGIVGTFKGCMYNQNNYRPQEKCIMSGIRFEFCERCKEIVSESLKGLGAVVDDKLAIKTVTVNEGNNLQFSCPLGRTISIHSSMFGVIQEGCSSSAAFNVTKSLCDGKQQCSLRATTSVFPMQGLVCKAKKTLRVTYQCDEECGTKVQYVRIRREDRTFLSFAEVEVYRESRNIASRKNVTQSSIVSTNSANFAVDTNRNGTTGVFRSNVELNPWWQVDLGEEYDPRLIPRVDIYNRVDCCKDRSDCCQNTLTGAIVEYLSKCQKVLRSVKLRTVKDYVSILMY